MRSDERQHPGGTAPRPNVLFVITDQQRADHVGFAGNEALATPNLDAVANRGCVFDNAWVANPICMPNRASIVTGRLPSSHGVIFNDRSLEWGANTFVRSFREAGWRTALLGKSHFQHGSSRNSMIPARGRPVSAQGWPDGWDTLEDEERYSQRPPEFPDDFYGFDHVELTLEHGGKAAGHHLLWALDKGARREDLVVPYNAEAPALERSDRWWQIYQPPYGPELHSTSFVAERTVAFIEGAARAGDPWLAWASFPDPHHPITPPGPWWERHDPAAMELPVTINDSLEHGPEHLRRVQGLSAADQYSWVMPFGAGDHQMVREATAATFATVEMIDEAVGRILAAVDRLGQREDTIVVFTSDHGEMLGDHGLMLKAYMHYCGTMQVPMVIDAPGFAPGRSRGLVSSLDLAPTLLELAGLPRHVGMQGRSVRPILEDPAASVRDELLVEEDAPPLLSRLTGYPLKTRSIVRSDGTKFTKYSSRDRREDTLFDLLEDPSETSPILQDGTRRAEAVEALCDLLIDADDVARGQAVEAPTA